MKLKDFDYQLPRELIAQQPARPRDSSRLLVLDRMTGGIEHRRFFEIGNFLRAGDVLVVNDSEVFPARLFGKKETGGRLEVFLHKKIKGGLWECLIGGRTREGVKIVFGRGLSATILKNCQNGVWEVKFNRNESELKKIAARIGLTPLPPYIKRKPGGRKSDRLDYQTVYAGEKNPGSVAAPTAGLHFTPRLIKKLKDRGVQIEKITLHVGLGTFAPVKVGRITDHKMHSEWAKITPKTLSAIVKARQEGRRIVAVGTTSIRTLEAAFASGRVPVLPKRKSGFQSDIDLFIYPGYKFKAVDAIITNFHLPESTLLMLVSAFAGRKKILSVYREAVRKKYRFFSYGDAMLIF